MKKLTPYLLVLVLAVADCTVKPTGPVINPPTPPTPPAPLTRNLVVHVCEGSCARDQKIPGTVVSAGAIAVTADAAGNAVIAVPLDAMRVCGHATRYADGCATSPAGQGELNLELALDVPPVLALRVDGRVFRDSAGAIWPYRGATSFLLLKRFVSGEDIRTYLDHRREAGANILRVLTNVSWGPLTPADYTDDQLRAFLAFVHSRGLRVEVVALADTLDWSLAKQRAHVQRVVDAVAATGALDLVEVSNEAFKNSKAPVEVMPGVKRRPGVLMASGGDGAACDKLTPFVLDYVTYHPERKDEWPRTAKDELELRDGFGCGKDAHGKDKPSYGGAHVPVVADEPMGAAEVNEPGRRSNVADDFYWFAATSQLLGAGGTFHSEAGLTSSEPGPLQAAAERAFYAGMGSVAPDAQLGLYTRGGLGNEPLEHDDTKALRTFCSLQGDRADCVVIRPSADWVARAVNGWRIVNQEGPRGSRVRLSR